MTTVVTKTDSRQPTDNAVPVPDAKRLSVSGPTMPRPHSTESSAPSSLYPGTPTTYKLETVTYAPAIALVVPGKDALSSSSPPTPILGSDSANTSLSSFAIPPGRLLGTYAPATEGLSQDQGLYTKMRIPAAHAINEYDIPTAEVVGSESRAAWRHSREGSQAGSTPVGHSAPQSQSQSQRRSLVASTSELNSRLSSNGMFSNAATSTSTLHPQRHILERRITEEELQGVNSSTVDLGHGGGGGQKTVVGMAVASTLVEVFDNPENDNNEEDDEDELPIELEDQLIQQGKLAVFENPRFMSEQRKKELERERERERMKVANVQEGQEQESELEPVKEKKRFAFLHHKKPTPTHGPSQSDTGHAPTLITPATAAPSTPKTSPLKIGGTLPHPSPTKTSPSKRFLGSLKDLFGVRLSASPSQAQDSASPSPSPSKLRTRKQDRNLSPSRFRAHSPSRIRTTNDDYAADSDSEANFQKMNGVKQQAGVGQTPAGGGQGMIVDLGKRRRRVVSEHITSPSTKSGEKNAVSSPAAAPTPAATSTPAATAVTPSRLTKTRKPSIGKTQTVHTTPNIKAGGSTQPHAQPQPHHQHPTSHFTSSSGGGATVLAAGGSHPSGTLISHPGWDTQALPTAGGGLSRNNSTLSAASAPTGGSSGSGMSKTKKQKQTVLGHGMGSGPSLGRRNSLGSSSGHTVGGGGKGEKKTIGNVVSGGSSTGPVSSVVQPTHPAPSLMSIVEDVTKHNREWNQESSQLLKNKNKIVGRLEKEKMASARMVDVVKAPPRVGRDELAQLDPATIKSRVMETSTIILAPGAVTSASAGSGTNIAGGTRLVDIKAPRSVLDQQNAKILDLAPAAQQGIHHKASMSTPNLTQSQQAHSSNLTRRASVTATTTPPGKRPAKSPLRSALKNQSRTPSPLPGPFLVPHLQRQQQHLQQQAVQEGSRHSDKSNNVIMVAPVPVSPAQFSTILGPAISRPSQPQSGTNALADFQPTKANGRPTSSDSASQRRKGKGKNKAAVSAEVVGESGDAGDSASTNTGNDIFYTDDEGDHSDAVVVSSSTDKPPMLNGHADGYTALSRSTGVIGSSSELSKSTTSTAVAQRPTIPSAPQPITPPSRTRKSVRVSLQPTFSPSPPAIEYDDEEEQKYHAPWAWNQDLHHNTEGVTGGGGGPHVHTPIPVAAAGPFLTSGHRVVTPEQPSAYVHDIWEDSSDEDAEYQNAKRLLTRAARKEKDVNALAIRSRS